MESMDLRVKIPAGIVEFSPFFDEERIDDHLMEKREISFKVYVEANMIVAMT